MNRPRTVLFPLTLSFFGVALSTLFLSQILSAGPDSLSRINGCEDQEEGAALCVGKVLIDRLAEIKPEQRVKFEKQEELLYLNCSGTDIPCLGRALLASINILEKEPPVPENDEQTSELADNISDSISSTDKPVKGGVDPDSIGCGLTSDGKSYSPLLMTKKGIFYGSSTNGFPDRTKCMEMVDGIANNMICAWTGKDVVAYHLDTYQPVISTPFSVYDKEFEGKIGSAIGIVESCNKGISKRIDDFICHSVGANLYLPVNTATGRIYYGNGIEINGFDENWCYQAIEARGEKAICTWNVGSVASYVAVELETGNIIQHFGQKTEGFESCKKFSSLYGS